MNKKRLTIIVTAVILLSGFIMPLFMEELTFCTQKFCSCNEDNEIECNTCAVYKPVYFTILLNLGRTCNAEEIIMCQDSQDIGRRYDKKDCKYIWNSIFTGLNRNDGIVLFE